MSVLGTPEQYQVVLHHRGGATVYSRVDVVQKVAWERRLDDVATCTVTAQKWGADPDCCGRVGAAEPYAHEVSLYRDGQLVWQGPLLTVTETRSGLTLAAADVLAWSQVRVNQDAFNYEKAATDVGLVAERLIQDGYGQDDPGVLDYAVYTRTGTDTTRKADAETAVIWDQLHDLAGYGLDITTVGRRIVCLAEDPDQPGTRGRMVLTADHIIGDVAVTRDSSALATEAVVAGQGVVGHAGGPVLPYGLVTRVVRDEQVTTQATADRLAMQAAASGATPSTVIVVPDNAQLAPSTPAGIADLVCGRRFDLSVSGFCREVWQPMRLSRVSVTWQAGKGETVGVSFLPLHDTPVGGG